MLNIFLGTITWVSFYIDIVTSLISVMIPLLLFNLIYDHFTKSHQNLEMSDSIANALMLNKSILSRFSSGARKSFIKNSTESLLGNEEGRMLYTTLIAPYLDNKYNFRRNFKYNICYSESPKVYSYKDHTAQFDPEYYYWVEEELSF
ncbi:hypothetical protein CR194_09790 [Salipaludibacillus keqinensis]|uniref:Uncharacterized protein n=1 Tax=Salipaludibacillus keqinensis TaxID=2045207 RepID=A0A323THP0_9BACI|nr:hypothetical protein CR194_09790 [Salipaludibacillus keqinensis]